MRENTDITSKYLLEGGDGVPRQREKNFAPITVLRLQNWYYLKEQRSKPVSTIGWGTWALAIFFLALGLVILLSPIDPSEESSSIRLFTRIIWDFTKNNPGIVIGIAFVIAAICFLVIVLDYLAINKLTREGVLLLGQVVKSESEYGKSSLWTLFSTPHEVTVYYKVKLPDGRVIEDKSTARRDDLSAGSLPRRGQTVAVLYCNDVVKTLL
jgi:hypothetical protein